MSFTRPQELSYRFSPAPKQEICEAITNALTNFPERIEPITFDFLANQANRFDVVKLNHVHAQMTPFRTSKNHLSVALSNFIEFQNIAHLCRSPFTFDSSAPLQVERIFRWAAGQLDTYGHNQARELLATTQKVLTWCKQTRVQQAHIVDSPIGGSFPSRILQRTLQEAGINAEIVEFLAPRLERHPEKHSIRDATKKLATRFQNDTHPIIFMDEVLTGTRFTKLFDALKRILHDRLIPVALVVRNPSNNRSSQLTALTKRLVEIRKGKRIPTLHEFSQLPLIKIDDGNPFQSSNVFYWAELDLCAGKRKVNLLFGLLHQLREICDKLSDPQSPAMQHLIKLWSIADDGKRYEGHDVILRKCIPELISRLDWNYLLARAREEFPADYKGEFGVEPSESWVLERMNWALDNISDQANPGFKLTNSSNEGWMIRRALQDLFAFYSGHRSPRMPRDRDFAEYTIRFERPHQAFHEELVNRCFLRK